MADEAPVPEEAELLDFFCFFPPEKRDLFFLRKETFRSLSSHPGCFFVKKIFHLFVFFVPDFVYSQGPFFKWHPRNEAGKKNQHVDIQPKNEADRKSPDRKTSANAHPMERNSMGSTFQS